MMLSNKDIPKTARKIFDRRVYLHVLSLKVIFELLTLSYFSKASSRAQLFIWQRVFCMQLKNSFLYEWFPSRYKTRFETEAKYKCEMTLYTSQKARKIAASQIRDNVLPKQNVNYTRIPERQNYSCLEKTMVTNPNSLESKANSLVPLFQNESKGERIHLKMTLICMKMNPPVGGIIFMWMVLHLDSFWYRDKRLFGNGLLLSLVHCFTHAPSRRPSEEVTER